MGDLRAEGGAGLRAVLGVEEPVRQGQQLVLRGSLRARLARRRAITPIIEAGPERGGSDQDT